MVPTETAEDCFAKYVHCFLEVVKGGESNTISFPLAQIRLVDMAKYHITILRYTKNMPIKQYIHK